MAGRPAHTLRPERVGRVLALFILAVRFNGNVDEFVVAALALAFIIRLCILAHIHCYASTQANQH